jgi:hypothetical protein
VVGKGGFAGEQHSDRVDALRNEAFIAGGVEALNEDSLRFGHEDQAKGILNLEDQFLVQDDVERAEFQSGSVILAVEGA